MAGTGGAGVAVATVGQHGLAYAWKEKPVRRPAQSSTWQITSLRGSRTRRLEEHYLRDFEGLAEHWINGRYVSRVIGRQGGGGTRDTQRSVREEEVDEDDLSDSMEELSITENVTRSKRKRQKRREFWENEMSARRTVGRDALLLRKLATREHIAQIRYYAWHRGYADRVPGYFVVYQVFGMLRNRTGMDGEAFHIRRIGNLDWWERIQEDEIPYENRYSQTPAVTVSLYLLNDDPLNDNIPEDPDHIIRVFQASYEPNVFREYSLRTTREACALIRDVRLGIREQLRVRPPGLEQRDRMGAWADVQGISYFHFIQEPIQHVLPRTVQLQADADMDTVTETFINLCPRGPQNFIQYSWEEGRHFLWPRSQYRGLELLAWEIWVEFEEDGERERRIWLHCVHEDTWNIVEPRGRRSVVTHVRAEMKFVEGEGDDRNERWDAVRANFDGSKNAVYMFVKSNSQGVILDRMIVKPVINEYHTASYENLADDFGFNVTPREIHINKLVDRMFSWHRDLFTHCRHYSGRTIGGVDTYYMYLQYEPGGSLASLLKRHVKAVKRHDELVSSEKRKVGERKREEEKRKASKKRKAPGDKPETEELEPDADFMCHLPEIFLWYVFERLVKACCRLRHDPVMQEHQRGFVHHDLKPANMLLRHRPGSGYRSALDPGGSGINVGVDAGAANRVRAAIRGQMERVRVGEEEEELGVRGIVEAIARVQGNEEAGAEAGRRRQRQEGFGTGARRREPSETRGQDEMPRRLIMAPNRRAHPIPIVSDLEYCYRLGRDQIWYGFGTQGFLAPEHLPPFPGSPLTTDVFQIGCVMYSLMSNSYHGVRAANKDGEYLGRRGTTADFDVDASIEKVDKAQNYRRMHSQNLRRLVDQCLRKSEHERPEPRALLVEVQRGLRAHDKAIGGAVDLNYDEVHRWFRVDGMEERFVIGEPLPDMAKQRDIFGGRAHPSWDPYGTSGVSRFTHMLSDSEDEDVAASGVDSAAGVRGS